MANDIQSVAGSKIGISTTAPATFNEAGYSALTYINIGECTELPTDIGRVYNVIKHNPVDTRATRKLRGSYDEGSSEFTCGLVAGDAGQAAAFAALSSDAMVYFEITLQDTNDKIWFPALIVKAPMTIGSVDNVLQIKFGVEITSSTTGVGIVTSFF